jgi:hypothetical protein
MTSTPIRLCTHAGSGNQGLPAIRVEQAHDPPSRGTRRDRLWRVWAELAGAESQHEGR